MFKLFTAGIFVSLFPILATAAHEDHDFVYGKMQASGCPVNSDAFADEFANAIDRLASLNPKLVDHIRTVSYSSSFSIKCDLPATSGMIWWVPAIRTIRLREDTPDTWRTASNVFHEFLHFVGVQIDIEAHNRQPLDVETAFETDSVYACRCD